MRVTRDMSAGWSRSRLNAVAGLLICYWVSWLVGVAFGLYWSPVCLFGGLSPQKKTYKYVRFLYHYEPCWWRHSSRGYKELNGLDNMDVGLYHYYRE